MSLLDSSEATDVKEQNCEQEEGNPQAQVHSANSWETADLGDKQRNEKFLRLMGASKKEHHGKIVIGENASANKRDKECESHVQEKLVKQFAAGMEHRLAGGRKGHLGLGFHPETTDVDQQQENPTAGDANTLLAATGKPVADASGEDAVEEERDQAVAAAPGGDDFCNSEATSETSRVNDECSREKDERKREISDKNDGLEHVKKMKFVKSAFDS